MVYNRLFQSIRPRYSFNLQHPRLGIEKEREKNEKKEIALYIRVPAFRFALIAIANAFRSFGFEYVIKVIV